MAGKFNKPNLDQLNEYMNQSASSDGIRWYRLGQGTTILRILPPWSARGLIALTVYNHRIEYMEPGSRFTKYSWVCLNRTFGKRCNICEGLNSYHLDTEEYGANERVFYANALVIQDPEYGRKSDATAPWTHVLIKLPKTVHDWVISQITNPAVGDITDVESGIDIMVTKTGSGLDTRYSTTLSPNGRTAIPDTVLNSLELYDLDSIFGTGFEDKRIEDMLGAISQSNANLSAAVPQYQAQMNPNIPYQQPIYPQAPAYQVPQVPTYPIPQAPVSPSPQTPYQANPTPAASPYQVSNTPSFPSVPTSPYGAVVQQPAAVPPVAPPMEQAPVQSQAPAQNLPKCFGHYDISNPTCVVCPKEIECSKSSK